MESKNVKRGVCRLHQREEDLVRSHIVSEFLYDPIYDEKHRMAPLHADPDRRVRHEQKGIREHLLCKDAEQHVQPFEDYAARFFSGRAPITESRLGPHRILTGVDYASLKLFVLTTFWRASVSSHEMYRRVKLGPHEERLRQMILNRNPGKTAEYGCIAMQATLDGRRPLDLITEPYSNRLDSHRTLEMIFGGYMWEVFVTSHPVGEPWLSLFLREDGTFPVGNNAEASEGYFKRLLPRFQESLRRQREKAQRDTASDSTSGD